MSSELAKNNMELDTPLKKRLYQLMTDDEKLLPFSFANRIGISKSTFHSIWTKGSTSIHRGTAKKIADATGVDIDWLHKGVGVPYPDEGRIVQPSDGTEFDHLPEPLASDLKAESARHQTADDVINNSINMRLGFHPDYIADALDIIDDIVSSSDVYIDNHTKAELIIKLCSLLNTDDSAADAKDTISSVLRLIKAS